MVTAVKLQIINITIAGKNSIFSWKNDRPILTVLWLQYGSAIYGNSATWASQVNNGILFLHKIEYPCALENKVIHCAGEVIHVAQ